MKKIKIIAIIFSILTILFFLGSILISADKDTSVFLDDLTYSEGIVKEAKQGVDNKGKIIAYSVILEENIVLTIDIDSMVNADLANVKVGDKVAFKFSGSPEKLNNTNTMAFITPVFLSCNDKCIVSLESYEQSILKNKQTSASIGFSGACIFLIISIVLFSVDFIFKKTKKK
jgi:hypothetical protein